MTVPHSYTAVQLLEPVSELRYWPSSLAMSTPLEREAGPAQVNPAAELKASEATRLPIGELDGKEGNL